MADNEYDVGDVLRVTGTFTDVDGNLVDPTTVTLRVKDSAGQTSTIATTNPSQGVYRGEIELTRAGRWFYRWQSTNPNAAEEVRFQVKDQIVPSP